MKKLFDRFFKGDAEDTGSQFVRYLFVGGLAFIVDFGSLWALTEFAGLHYLVSATIAFGLGLATNYLLSISWVFSNRSLESRSAEFTVFATIGVLGLGLNNGILYVLTDLVSVHYLGSKLVATGVVFFWNFGARKAILFRSGAGD